MRRRKNRRRRADFDLVQPTPAPIRGPRDFEVLCRIDAYAHYVALVEADSAREAAELANDFHEDYQWQANGVCEFDSRCYVTLNENGDEIEETLIGDR